MPVAHQSSADENSLTAGAVLVPEALSLAAAGCSSPDAGHRAVATSKMTAFTGAPATLWAAADETPCFSKPNGLANSAAQDEQKASILRQQNASRRCFAVVPPWAVHVPILPGQLQKGTGRL